MSNTVDILFLELMASKICHDLISPIGAVNNGVEFLEEMGADAGKDVTDLIAFSAAQASAKLRAFRMAYGAGGADSNIKPEDVKKAIADIIDADGKIKQDWDAHAPLGFDERPEGYCKILLNALMLAMECLPKGGTIRVAAGGPNETRIEAQGPDAGFRGRAAEAFANTMGIDGVEPKYVHAYASQLLARKYGFKLLHETGDGVFTLRMAAL